MAIQEPFPTTDTRAEQAVQGHACPCWHYAALGLSCLGVLGALGLTWLEGLTACPLCFYQRVFLMGALGALVVGALVPDLRPGRASLFALPMAMGGFAVAVFHVNLELSGRLECPRGLFGFGTAPVQSLVTFLVLLLLLGADMIEARKTGHGIPAIGLGAGVLGLLFAIGLIFSGPPMPVYSDDPGFQKRFKYDLASPVECRPPAPPR